jgi:hypothetical protein
MRALGSFGRGAVGSFGRGAVGSFGRGAVGSFGVRGGECGARWRARSSVGRCDAGLGFVRRTALSSCGALQVTWR